MQENYETSTNIIEHPSFPHMSNYWTSHLRNTSLVKESESKHSEIGENTDFGAKRHSVTWNTRTSKSLKECSSATAELWAVQKCKGELPGWIFFSRVSGKKYGEMTEKCSRFCLNTACLNALTKHPCGSPCQKSLAIQQIASAWLKWTTDEKWSQSEIWALFHKQNHKNYKNYLLDLFFYLLDLRGWNFTPRHDILTSTPDGCFTSCFSFFLPKSVLQPINFKCL